MRPVIVLLEHINDSIERQKLFRRGEKILVAVSGGMDSMVLLHALRRLSVRHRWRLTVAHFNHQLRGGASDADEKLVRTTAAKMKLPVAAAGADVKRFAKQGRLSIEMAARKLRHEFLARAARERGIKTVALAHHADDQVELFFLRLLRGAGTQGLSGMKWQSPSPADKTIALARPLLDLHKNQLLAFAAENKTRYREDATNRSTDFLRNRIRHELLPLLRGNYQPSADKMILRVMEILGAESEFIADVVNGLSAAGDSSKTNAFDDLPVALQRRLVQSRLLALGFAADFESIETLRRSPGIPVSIGPNLSVSRNAAGDVALHQHQARAFNNGRMVVRLGRAGDIVFGGANFRWALRSKKKPRFVRGREFFDADKVGTEVLLRHWQAGDRFQPIGLKSRVKLQDLFINAKVPREERHERVVATTSAGEIFWVEGLRIGERFKLGLRTKKQLQWEWSRNLC